MRITFRTYLDEIRSHRMAVQEIISILCRTMMRNIRRHDLVLTTAPCKEKFEQVFPELKDKPWYSAPWYDIITTKCPLEYDHYLKNAKYQIDPEENRLIKDMDLCQILELTADIVSHAQLQQVSPYVMLLDYLARNGIRPESNIACVMANTIKTIQHNVK